MLGRVGACVAGGEPVVNVSPAIGTGVGGIDAELLDGVDRLQHALDVRPGRDTQKDVAAGPHGTNRREGFAWLHGAQDVDARDDGAVIVRRPTDKCECAAPRPKQPGTAEMVPFVPFTASALYGS